MTNVRLAKQGQYLYTGTSGFVPLKFYCIMYQSAWTLRKETLQIYANLEKGNSKALILPSLGKYQQYMMQQLLRGSVLSLMHHNVLFFVIFKICIFVVYWLTHKHTRENFRKLVYSCREEPGDREKFSPSKHVSIAAVGKNIITRISVF